MSDSWQTYQNGIQTLNGASTTPPDCTGDAAIAINQNFIAIANLFESTPDGTVTSVGMTVPSEFSVSSSPITTSGTLAISKATQSANKVWAGPSSGAAAAPAFRSLVAADIPTLNQSTTGTAAGLSGSQTANTVYAAPNGSAGAASFRALVSADVPSQANGTAGQLQYTNGTTIIGDTAVTDGGGNLSATSLTLVSGEVTPALSITYCDASALVAQVGIKIVGNMTNGSGDVAMTDIQIDRNYDDGSSNPQYYLTGALSGTMYVSIDTLGNIVTQGSITINGDLLGNGSFPLNIGSTMNLNGNGLNMSTGGGSGGGTMNMDGGSIVNANTIACASIAPANGFTGTGAYTTFTIVNGIITSAS